MQVRFGEVAEAAMENYRQCDVVQGGVVGGRVARVDAAGVLAHGRVAAVVVAVLDLPVAAVPGEQTFGVGAFGGHRGDAEGRLHGCLAGLRVGALADDEECLPGLGEGGERSRQQVAGGDAARLDAAVALGGRVGVVAHGGCVPIDGGELREGLGTVRLDRQHVVGAVRLDDGALGVAGGVQGVEGDHAAAQVDVLDQRAQGGDLAALVAAAAARGRATGVRDQRHGLEVNCGELCHGLAIVLWIRESERDAFVYGLLLKHANVAKDKNIQKVYFFFLEEHELGMQHPVKLVPMNAAEFVTALRRLNAEKKLSFDSRLLTTALRGKIPTETEDWMDKALVENIKPGLEREPGLFDVRVNETLA